MVTSLPVLGLVLAGIGQQWLVERVIGIEPIRHTIQVKHLRQFWNSSAIAVRFLPVRGATWGNVRQQCDSRAQPLTQTAFDRVSAMRVCHLGPVAFQRAKVSGGRRNEMDVRTQSGSSRYNHPLLRAIRAASMRLPAPNFKIASER
jgi:hypothetical protein